MIITSKPKNDDGFLFYNINNTALSFQGFFYVSQEFIVPHIFKFYFVIFIWSNAIILFFIF